MELYPTPNSLYSKYTQLELEQGLTQHGDTGAKNGIENGAAAANAASSVGRKKGKAAAKEAAAVSLPAELLKDLACGAQQRNLGPKLSQFISVLHLQRQYV
jgi:hypothetical protein